MPAVFILLVGSWGHQSRVRDAAILWGMTRASVLSFANRRIAGPLKFRSLKGEARIQKRVLGRHDLTPSGHWVNNPTMILHTLTVLAVASCTLFLNPNASPQDGAKPTATPPSSQVPATRTDKWAIDRETEQCQ